LMPYRERSLSDIIRFPSSKTIVKSNWEWTIFRMSETGIEQHGLH